ncbi:palmitoyltransferase ZDHHC18 isoform X1 [Euwallacea similis]|uniref:palmitoyltransferase ZDHHC18 isoform X1 n=1 Tax=Euwallacea similis TaxID=1736056 RepID=UPI003450A79D
MTMARERITRKWEIFQGRNKFYCSGRFMTAPNAGVFLLTVFLITVTSTLFFIFDCKYLAENVTIAIPVIGAILFIFTMSSLLRTSLTDPGIIPRATSEEAAYVEKQIEVTNSANSPTYRPPPRTKEVLVKGQTVKLKYCFTCKLFRPPRASHCSICDNCVERFDHHCPWVGNCVGRRNYRFFYMFIISLAFLAVFIFACAVAHLILITKEGKFFEAVKDSPASAIVAVICFFSVWSVLGLAGFHTYLTTSNQTTNEDIKGSFTSKRGQDSFNPYSEGNVCVNCFHILCGPVTPSLIDRRGIVTDSYRSEISQPIIFDSPLAAANYSLKIQNGTSNSADLPGGIYRQTTETTGMYSPLKRHLLLAQQIIPTKHCANQKVIPSQSPLIPLHNLYQRPVMVRNGSIAKNSHSLPYLTRMENCVEEYFEYDKYYNPYNSRMVVYQVENKSHRTPPPPEISEQADQFTRPYTPPEKRYNSSTFGYKPSAEETSIFKKEQVKSREKTRSQQRPRSSCIYENVHVTSEDLRNHNVKHVKFDRSPVQNVKFDGFPRAEFSHQFVQKRVYN